MRGACGKPAKKPRKPLAFLFGNTPHVCPLPSALFMKRGSGQTTETTEQKKKRSGTTRRKKARHIAAFHALTAPPLADGKRDQPLRGRCAGLRPAHPSHSHQRGFLPQSKNGKDKKNDGGTEAGAARKRRATLAARPPRPPVRRSGRVPALPYPPTGPPHTLALAAPA